MISNYNKNGEEFTAFYLLYRQFVSKKCFLSDRPNSYWIGLQNRSSNCQSNEPFSCWNDGTRLTYNGSWYRTEPSSDIDENCVVMGHPSVQNCDDHELYEWFNILCTGVRRKERDEDFSCVIPMETYLASFICHRTKGNFYKTLKFNYSKWVIQEFNLIIQFANGSSSFVQVFWAGPYRSCIIRMSQEYSVEVSFKNPLLG